MVKPVDKFPFPIVFMTDRIIDGKDYSVERNDAEGNSRKVAYAIRDALSSVCQEVLMLEEAEEYTKRLPALKDWVMFSTRYGVASPSSKAQIPAICEANHVRYIGADSYCHMLCNDKYMSKKYVQEFGLHTAPAVLIRNANDSFQLDAISFLRYPVVIKPNYGGGSTGITCDNVQKTPNGAIEYVKFLQQYHHQPILVEEYIPGYEVEVIVFGNQKRILMMDEIKILINGSDYFTESIYDLETKKIHDDASVMTYCKLLSDVDKQALANLFCSFPKVEYMRIDCRIYNGHVYVIELSPDCYLGEDGGVYMAFKKRSIDYKDMFSLMIQNALFPDELQSL